jgi:hypothetical protein
MKTGSLILLSSTLVVCSVASVSSFAEALRYSYFVLPFHVQGLIIEDVVYGFLFALGAIVDIALFWRRQYSFAIFTSVVIVAIWVYIGITAPAIY